MTLRTLALAGAAGLALSAALGSAASAQQAADRYSRVVVFGDSLSDDGNLAQFGAAPPAPYFGGRFSNGPVYTELLGFGPFGAPGTTAGSVNYAYGGARTDTLVAIPPGLAAQFATYRNAGGTFGPNDLVIAWGGANDIFQNFQTAASNPATALNVLGATAQQAAINQATLTGQIIAAGGRTVLVGNLPDLGRTPQFTGLGASAAQLAGAGGSVFNSELATRLNAVAAANPAANVILFDTNRGLSAIVANPAAFGITNTTQSCFVSTPAPSVCANPDQYLYWDGVHPTAAGQRIIAALANDYLTYAERGQASTLLTEASLQHREQATDAIFERIGGRELNAAGGWVAFDYGETSIDARRFVGATDLQTQILRIGLEHGGDGMLVGFAANLGKTEANGQGYDFDVDTFGADAYVAWRGAGHFLNLSAGGGADKYDDIRRTTAATPIVHTAFSEGWHMSAKAQFGFWADLGGLDVSPRVAVSAVKVRVDGYTEDGAAARHVVAQRDLEAVFGEASVRAEAPLGALRGFAEVGYRTDLTYDGEPIRVRLFDNPAQQLTASHDDLSGGTATVDAGITGPIVENLNLGLAYRGRFGDAWDSHQARVTLNLAF